EPFGQIRGGGTAAGPFVGRPDQGDVVLDHARQGRGAATWPIYARARVAGAPPAGGSRPTAEPRTPAAWTPPTAGDGVARAKGARSVGRMSRRWTMRKTSARPAWIAQST